MTTLDHTSPNASHAAGVLESGMPYAKAGRRHRQSSDFVELTKLRLNVMVLITTAIGFALATPAAIHWQLFLHTLLGTALCAAGASVLNQAWEWRLDRRMARTTDRPVAAGRLQPAEATLLGLLMTVCGTLQLALEATPLTAILAAATVALYVLVYTPLKTRTTLNTLVGAVPGAIPPLIGYAAAAGGWTIDALGWTLFAILFCWQMPHFLAIAVLLKDDYAAAGYKMLPIRDTRLVHTGVWMIFFTLALIAASLTPLALRPIGAWYGVVAVLLGAAFLAACIAMLYRRTRGATRVAFFASIIYLPLALGALLIAGYMA